MKLSDIADPRLRERIKRQIEQDEAARRTSKPLVGLADPKPEQDQVRALDRKPSAHQGRKSSVALVVGFTPYCNFECDDDNFGSGNFKSLRDEIAKTLGIDDGDKRVKFEYHTPIYTKGKPGTIVNITLIEK